MTSILTFSFIFVYFGHYDRNEMREIKKSKCSTPNSQNINSKNGCDGLYRFESFNCNNNWRTSLTSLTCFCWALTSANLRKNVQVNDPIVVKWTQYYCLHRVTLVQWRAMLTGNLPYKVVRKLTRFAACRCTYRQTHKDF